MLEACGRREAPASKVFRLQREGLENDFSPLTARSLGPRAARRGESNSYSGCVLRLLLWSKGFLKDLVPLALLTQVSLSESGVSRAPRALDGKSGHGGSLGIVSLLTSHWSDYHLFNTYRAPGCAKPFAVISFNLFFKNLFIYLFLAALGLRCCTRAFSSCGEWGLLFVVVCRLLIAVASLVVEHRL